VIVRDLTQPSANYLLNLARGRPPQALGRPVLSRLDYRTPQEALEEYLNKQTVV